MIAFLIYLQFIINMGKHPRFWYLLAHQPAEGARQSGKPGTIRDLNQALDVCKAHYA